MTNPTAPTDGATPSSWLPTWLCGRRKPGRVCCRASGSVDLLSPFTLRVQRGETVARYYLEGDDGKRANCRSETASRWRRPT